MQHTTPRIPFGKHAGSTVAELDTRYTVWLASQSYLATRYPDLFNAVLDEIERRLYTGRLRADLFTPPYNG